MAHGTTIKVLYFAQVAEIIGKQTEILPLPQAMPISTWLEQLMAKYPRIKSLRQIKIALNQEHANPDQIINPGDELAVFEPVTGG